MSTVRPSAVADVRVPAQRRGRVIPVLTAVVLALAGWVVEKVVLGVPLKVHTSPGGPVIEVAVGSVLIASLVVGVAAWGLLALLERVTTNARRVWTIVAVIVLLVSFLGPLGGVQGSTVLALMCLHVLVGGALIVGLRRSATR